MQRGDVIGRYVLESQLGRGGMGEVWRATDAKLNRAVAIKLLLHHQRDDIARFKREAEVAANLKHAGIAAIYEFGEAVTGPFLAMQLIEGVPLERAQLGLRESARAIRDAALAVDHAHQQGVVHRDLKPNNIMISFDSITPSTKPGAGDRPAPWQITVMDFGLAKRVAGPSSLSASGMAFGTPAYMSPEQAQGRTDVDARADIYGLGATLYSLCAGRPPFNSPDVARLLADVVESDPPAPRRINPAIPPDLETVILKCLEKDPARRYATAAALADDIGRFLEGDPIQARPASMAYVAWKRLKKRPLTVATVTALSALLAAAVGFATNRYVAALGSERQATGAFHAAEESAAKLRSELERQSTRVRAAAALRPASEALAMWEVRQRRLPPIDQKATREAIEEALRIAPDYGPALVERGRFECTQGRVDDAMKSLEQALADPAARADALYFRGRQALLRFIYLLPAPRMVLDGARLQVDLSDRLKPLPEDARMRDLAIHDLEAYVGMVPSGRDDPRVQWAMSLLEYAQATTPEALRRAAERMRPGAESLRIPRWEAMFYIGSAWFDGERFDKALEAFRDCIEYGGTGPAPWIHVGASLWAMSKSPGQKVDLNEALAAYDQAAALSPDTPTVNYSRALVLRDLDRRSEALTAVDRALKIQPSADAWSLRAVIRQEGRDAAGAVEDYTKAIAMAPNDPRLLANRASARRAMLDDDGAMRDLEAALKIDPDCVSALINRAGLRKKRGDFEGAVGDASRAIQLNPTHPGAYLNRGNARAALKDYRGALDDWTKFVELAPDHAFVPQVRRDIDEVKRILEDEK